MSVIFIALPIAILLAAGALAGFIWAVRGGQYEDLDSPPWRMVVDEEDEVDEKDEEGEADGRATRGQEAPLHPSPRA